MASLAAFRALRPTPDVAARVAAVPYDVVSTDEARALAADPLSFLHVSRAEIDLGPEASPYSDQVYSRARQNFATLTSAAPLVREDAASLYVYRIALGAHTQTGVAGCFSVDDYDSGVIKKHEHTRVDKEDDRTRHIVELRAQTGPVFLTYRTAVAVNEAVDRVTRARPLFEFDAVDGVRHEVWRADAPSSTALVAAFGGVPTLYIADGHHRAASAARARRHFGGPAAARGAWDGFLAVAFPDREMNVLPYNRLVKDLMGLDGGAFLDQVSRLCAVQPGGPVPAKAGHVSMFLGQAWHDVTLPTPGVHATAAQSLDVSQLQRVVLAPLLGIDDPRTNARIEFMGGARGAKALEERVRSGAAAVAFSMFPVSVADLMAVSDAGDIMPPKSTWFEPKLRDGLLSHVI
ncbi:MAG TPA: DUF1015 family protein [Vicinamibacterales bacterium]